MELKNLPNSLIQIYFDFDKTFESSIAPDLTNTYAFFLYTHSVCSFLPHQYKKVVCSFWVNSVF
jgi:hypothetical protein